MAFHVISMQCWKGSNVTDLLSHLAPETESVVNAYLSQLDDALSTMRASERRDALDDTEEFFAERLTAESTPADAVFVAEELGSAVEFAASMLNALDRRPRRTESAAATSVATSEPPGAGTVLGMPYELRVPTASRVAMRWWDPTNPRIFVPRVWGIGWDVNFGAVAVKLGLIRPDDEDEPFGAVPFGVVVGALLIPIALTLSIVALAVAFGDRMPPELPAHWNIAGVPDRFWPASTALGFSLLMAGVPTVYAVYCAFANRARLQQAASIALASMMSVLGAGIYLQSVLWGLGRDSQFFTLPLMVAAFLLPFAQLTIFARIGRAEEWRRQLPPASRRSQR